VIFISIPRFRFRHRSLISLAAVIGVTAASCFGQPMFFSVPSTPYDHQMMPISSTLLTSGHPSSGVISLGTINTWMTQLRSMPYRYSPRWKTPREVTAATAADCKGKAVVIYERLRAIGARHVRFVIGKHKPSDLRTHAWVEWTTTEGNYVLDPTFNRSVQRQAAFDSMYIPDYAYDGAHKYRAIDAPIITQN
jgi:hypothetical protein